jgi:phage FluMu protein Com
MEKHWEQAEIQCPGCHEILVLRASLVEIWCPWCEEPYEVHETPHQTDPTRIVVTLVKKLQSGP